MDKGYTVRLSDTMRKRLQGYARDMNMNEAEATRDLLTRALKHLSTPYKDYLETLGYYSLKDVPEDRRQEVAHGYAVWLKERPQRGQKPWIDSF